MARRIPVNRSELVAVTAETNGDGDAVVGRSAQKRRAMMDSATALFLRDGYRNTSMEQIAADAGVSKQTLYKHFADKERLFREIILGVTANAARVIADITAALTEDVDSIARLQEVFSDLALKYLGGVLHPNVVSLRRLMIAEAERFPDLAHTYFDQAPARAISVLADAIRSYDEVGLLTAKDPQLAATHFAYLVLGAPQDRAQFHLQDRPAPAELQRLTTEAVRVFFAAYASSAGG